MARTIILTPYKATEIMNAHRRELGLKEVNSPMMYIQMKKGKFPAERNADGRWQIVDVHAFVEWVVQHNNRQVARKTTAQDTADVQQIVLELTAGDEHSHDEKTIDGKF